MRVRNSMAKAIYKKIFHLIIYVMNENQQINEFKSETIKNIGILDIAGFGLYCKFFFVFYFIL